MAAVGEAASLKVALIRSQQLLLEISIVAVQVGCYGGRGEGGGERKSSESAKDLRSFHTIVSRFLLFLLILILQL